MLDENDKQIVEDMIDKGINDNLEFYIRKRGDTPTDVHQLTPKGYVTGQISSVISSVNGVIASIIATIPSITGGGLFADGVDGDVTLDGTTSYTNFSSITVASSVYTLTRDLYANNLTINNSVKLFPSGYLPYVKNILTNNGFISRDGNTASGNTGATVLSGGTLPSIIGGVQGGTGGAGGTPGGGGGGGAGNIGNLGTAVTHSFFTTRGVEVNGGSGGQGGGGSPAPGGGIGPGGSVSGYRIRPSNPFNFESMLDTNANQTLVYYTTGGGSGGSGGGGGGQGLSTQGGNGGNGGGSGGPGGLLVIYAKTIVNNGALTVLGGNGGDGNNGTNGTGSADSGGGGGGSGSGGPGGIIFYVTNSFTNTGSLLTTGGNIGTRGNGGAPGGGSGGPGLQGNNGNNGNTGSVFGLII